MNGGEEFRNKDFIEDEMIQYCTTPGGAVALSRYFIITGYDTSIIIYTEYREIKATIKCPELRTFDF